MAASAELAGARWCWDEEAGCDTGGGISVVTVTGTGTEAEADVGGGAEVVVEPWGWGWSGSSAGGEVVVDCERRSRSTSPRRVAAVGRGGISSGAGRRGPMAQARVG